MLASWPMLLLVRLEVSAPIPLGQRHEVVHFLRPCRRRRVREGPLVPELI
jgi:hypothetical protein